MDWESKAELRMRIESLESYNRHLQEEVRRQHGKVMRLRKEAEETFGCVDLNERRLLLAVHDMRRREGGDFAMGWNQAVGHVENLITDLLGIELKSEAESMV